MLHVIGGLRAGHRSSGIHLNHRYLTNTHVPSTSSITANVHDPLNVVRPFDASKLQYAYDKKNHYVKSLFRDHLSEPTYQHYINLIKSDMQTKQANRLASGMTPNESIMVTRKELSRIFNKEFGKEMWFMAPLSYAVSFASVSMITLFEPLNILIEMEPHLTILTCSSIAIGSTYLARYYSKHRKVVNEILRVYYYG